MRVLSIELENVKSYVRQHVEFTEGINAVCGHNGSGKTTILEAIGFALFDFLPYNQSAFIREGQKSGIIRVHLLARDGKEYEVVRRIGAGAQYYVAYVGTGERIAERAPNVVDWVRSHAMGMDGGVDLESLFKNAIGVPQGLMTADFLQSSATARKGIFDPLLRVEEYRQAYEYLRETASYLVALSGTVREEVARLETETEPIGRLQGEADELMAEIESIGQQRGELERECADLTAVEASLQSLLESVAQRTDACERAKFDVERYRALREARRADFERAREARDIFTAAETGYRAYLEARRALETLERDRAERDELREQQLSTIGKLQSVHASIEALQDQWAQARESEQRASALEGEAGLQSELETRLAALTIQPRERNAVVTQVSDGDRSVADLDSSLVELDGRIARAEEARQATGGMEPKQRQLEEVQDRLSRIGPLKERQQELLAEGKRLRERFEVLSQRTKDESKLGSRLKELESEQGSYDDLEQVERDLRDQRAHAVATIDIRRVARADLAGHHCPLLDLTCPVVDADEHVLLRLDAGAEDLVTRVQKLDARLDVVGEQARAARAVEEEMGSLRIQLAELRGESERAQQVEIELQECRARYTELTAQVEAGNELETQRAELRTELEAMRKLHELAGQLPALVEQRAIQRGYLQRVSDLLDQARARLHDIEAVDRECVEIHEQLQVLGDPRGRRGQLLALASQLDSLSRKLEHEQSSLSEVQERLQAITGKLVRFEELDVEMEKHRSVESQCREHHDRYLVHRSDAESLPEREIHFHEAERDVQRSESVLMARQRELREIEEQYDSEHHALVREQMQQLSREIAVQSERHTNRTAQRNAVLTDLEYRLRQREKLEAQRAELNELGRVSEAVGFVRETLRAAGPAITETLLANISQTANDIYADIMDDHAADLRWTRDYEIIVQRGSDERKFAQLSGGEQMSAALAVRLALLKEMSDIDFAFFDEPTQNMDGERRTNLAEQIRAVRGFDQLIVISHDDTFEHDTDNLIRLRKHNEETELEPV